MRERDLNWLKIPGQFLVSQTAIWIYEVTVLVSQTAIWIYEVTVRWLCHSNQCCMCKDETNILCRWGSISIADGSSVTLYNMECKFQYTMHIDTMITVLIKSAVFLICFLFRLTKLRISDPTSTVGLSKPSHTTAIAAFWWSLSERGYSSAGTLSMNSPTGVQLWVRRPTMQLNWLDFCRSGWIQNQLCKWTRLNWGLAPDVPYWYHRWSWLGRGNVYDTHIVDIQFDL